jgi:alkanesulfonate monooxygenase SsuD/methylene tetrahydromethanopterin reductase-like flavin-dependent oxidoreductase (luciferase family)
MEIAVQATSSTGYDDLLSWVRMAEDLDLAAFGMPDHYISGDDEAPGGALDSFVAVAGLTRDTESIELVLLVSPVTWRHPAVVAKTAATLSDMSGGRVVVGLGAGWWEREHTLFGIPFPERSERFGMLEEALGYLRAAFADPPIDFSADHYSFVGFDMQPRPPLRLLVGGTGERRTPRLAGAYADEFNAYPAPWDVFEAKVDRARRAAKAVGRDPGLLRISTSSYLVVGETESEYRSSLASAAEAAQRSPEELEAGLISRNAPHGTWDRVLESLAGYRHRGVGRFYMQTFADDLESARRKVERLTGAP